MTSVQDLSGESRLVERLARSLFREVGDPSCEVWQDHVPAARIVLADLGLEQVGWLDRSRANPLHLAGCICTLKYEHSDFEPIYTAEIDRAEP